MINKKRKLLSLLLALKMITLSGCGKYVNNDNEGYSERKLNSGDHMILEVDRTLDILGTNGKEGLFAPNGYKILDFDYDYDEEYYQEYRDYVFFNKEAVNVKNPNNIGTPVNKESKNNTGVGEYEPGEHVLSNINRSVNILLGKDNEIIELVSPLGYTIIDYDYDKTETFEFENITYVNNIKVNVDNVNEFGKPTEDITIKNHNNGYYDSKEHILVTVDSNINFLTGKEGTKKIEAPNGYKVVDYDYDKTPYVEFETITYENNIPIIRKEKGFGNPVENIQINNKEKEYDVGEHILVKINKDVNISFGFDGTEQLLAPEGYEILDYDYDKTSYAEFETYVYINNKKVIVEDENNFGKVIEKEKTLELKK